MKSTLYYKVLFVNNDSEIFGCPSTGGTGRAQEYLLRSDGEFSEQGQDLWGQISIGRCHSSGRFHPFSGKYWPSLISSLRYKIQLLHSRTKEPYRNVC